MRLLRACHLLSAASISLLLAFPVLAQTQTTGRISGTVNDGQAKVIVHADVRAENQTTGEKHAAVTDDSGSYVLLSLSPGNYNVSVSAQGFSQSIFSGVSVGAGSNVTVDAVLQVGANDSEVTVIGSPPVMRTDTAEIATTFDSSSLSMLPLASRNPVQLLAVAPGISTPLINNSALGRNSPEISVNGARVSQNSFQINGVDANNISMHDFGDVALPAPESISEEVVQASMYDASVAGAGGASVEIITRSGANAVHGSAYEYFRNDVLNANDPNLKAVGLPRPVLRRNVYGATIGGPIRKDRAFYFFSYQGTDEQNDATNQSLYSSVLIDPCLGNDRSAATLMKDCAVSSVDPISLALLNAKLPNGQFLIPTPQIDGLATGTATSTFSEQQFNANVDYHFGEADLFVGKFFFSRAPLFSALGFSAFGASPSFPGFGTHILLNNRLLSLQQTHTFSPRTVNELRFGYDYVDRNEVPDEAFNDVAKKIARVTADQSPGMPQIYLARNAGGGVIGSNEITLKGIGPTPSLSDAVSLQRGKHNLQLGAGFRHEGWRAQSINALSYGEIDFAKFQDFLQGNSEFSLLGSGVGQADFQTTDYFAFAQDGWKILRDLNLNLGLRYELDPPAYEQQGRIGGFDPSLYLPPTQVDQNGFPLGPPARGIVMAANAPSEINIPGVTRVGKRILKSDDPYDFGPRIGLAWSPLDSGRLAVRAGYGIFISRPSLLYLALNFTEPPFYQISVFAGEPLQDPFPGAPASSSFPLVSSGTLLGSPYAFADRNNRNPYFQQFNASLAYEISREAVFQVAYVGSRGLRLYRQVSINQALIASTNHPVTNAVTGEVITVNTLENAALRAPLQGVDPGLFQLNESSGQSTYHSLQVSWNQRKWRGWQLDSSYTFSKSIDNSSSAGGGANTNGSLDPTNGIDSGIIYGSQIDPRANRGVSDFDRTHRFVLNSVWDVPPPSFGRDSAKAKFLLSNWQLSGILIAMSGLPVDIFDAAGGSLYGQIYGARPNWATGASKNAARTHVPSGYYFNPFAFQEAIVQPGQAIPSAHDPTALAGDAGNDYGNVGRNVLRGPAQSNLDLSVSRRFPIRESKNLEFRADLFNALNHADKGNPVSDISSATLDPNTGRVIAPGNFGRIVNADSSPRIVQLALKFDF
jgi:hypothetical protein